MEIKTPGLLLQTIPYLGKKQILKVFTFEEGLVTLLSKSTHSTALTSPFCLAEWVYRKQRSDLCFLQDGSLIDGFFELRQSYETLSAAGAMAKDILRLPPRKNPELYALLVAYFKKLPQFSNPDLLVASFHLKLLMHEGLLSLEPQCTCCERPACHLFEGESYCLNHGPTPGLSFNSEEWSQLQVLAFTRQFSVLQGLVEIPKEKIRRLFNERLAH